MCAHPGGLLNGIELLLICIFVYEFWKALQLGGSGPGGRGVLLVIGVQFNDEGHGHGHDDVTDDDDAVAGIAVVVGERIGDVRGSFLRAFGSNI